MAVDRRVAAVGAGCCLSGVVAANIPWLDALWASHEPGHNATYSGHRVLSFDFPDLAIAAAGGSGSNAKDL